MNQGRKVRTILNRDLVQENGIGESSNHLKTLSEETSSNEHSNGKKFTLFTDHSSSSSSNELMCTPHVINENNKAFEVNRHFKTAIIKNTNNFMNNSTTSSQNSQTCHFNNFNTSESNPELGMNSNSSSSSLLMDKLNARFETLPNNNVNQYQHNNAHHLHHRQHNHGYQHHNVNSHHYTSNNGNGMNGNGANHSVISMNNAELRRKNTSDSNVKMLAEHHNFYHVNNRRMILMNRQQQRAAAAAAAASASVANNTSGSTTPSGNNEHTFNFKELSETLNNSGATLQRHADLNEIYKAHMKYKRGMNSSSNSLVSLNSSR